MPRVLIVAYGNPLRCDDGLAWRVAEQLSAQTASDDVVEIIACHQLTPELAQPVSQAEMVLFIDAASTGKAGETTSVSLKPERQSSVFSHDFSPATILSVAQDLYGTCPEAFVISVCGKCFEHGETLSPEVEESLPHVVELVGDLIKGARRVEAP